MKKIIFSVFIIIIAIVSAYYSAGYFGLAYDKNFPTELNSGWIGSSSSLQFIRGISLSLIFFLTIFSYPWVFKSWKSTLWLISPLLLWEITVDIKHIYIPIILVLIGFSLAWLLRKIFVRHHNLPMVIRK